MIFTKQQKGASIICLLQPTTTTFIIFLTLKTAKYIIKIKKKGKGIGIEKRKKKETKAHSLTLAKSIETQLYKENSKPSSFDAAAALSKNQTNFPLAN